MPAAAIRTQRLTKRYGSARGVEALDLEVRRGEVFGFLGPNGAGKTTTIRTLLDLLHPTSGTATILGLDSRRDSLAIRARVGNLPGDFAYDGRMTGEAMLTLFGRLRGLPDLGRAGELAERFEADLHVPLHELSRGNRQKLGLVQALFHAPELLVLDEPTSGLDPLMQEEFLTVVAEHRAAGGTVFLSSHELDEVERVCDRVGIIREGRLVAVDRVERMRSRAERDVRVRFGGPVPRREVERLPGVHDVRVDGDVLRCLLRGPVDPLVQVLARHRVEDLEIRRPTLETLFLGYYGQAMP